MYFLLYIRGKSYGPSIFNSFGGTFSKFVCITRDLKNETNNKNKYIDFFTIIAVLI